MTVLSEEQNIATRDDIRDVELRLWYRGRLAAQRAEEAKVCVSAAQKNSNSILCGLNNHAFCITVNVVLCLLLVCLFKKKIFCSCV